MRIITGTARGHKLKVPKVAGLRPAQDIVRQAIFSIIGTDIQNAVCLDLFAGSGSLGIEALSRGAKSCDFVDQNYKVTLVVGKNLAHCKLEKEGHIHQSNVYSFVGNCYQTYDFIFLDPPYDTSVFDLFEGLQEILEENGQLIYLHSKKLEFPDPIPGNFKLVDQRTFGATTVSFFRRLLN